MYVSADYLLKLFMYKTIRLLNGLAPKKGIKVRIPSLSHSSFLLKGIYLILKIVKTFSM